MLVQCQAFCKYCLGCRRVSCGVVRKFDNGGYKAVDADKRVGVSFCFGLSRALLGAGAACDDATPRGRRPAKQGPRSDLQAKRWNFAHFPMFGGQLFDPCHEPLSIPPPGPTMDFSPRLAGTVRELAHGGRLRLASRLISLLLLTTRGAHVA